MDSIIDALKQFLGDYIVALAVLIIGLIWLVWWLSAKYHSMKVKVDEIDGLPCKSHEESLSRISERLDKTGRVLDSIENRLGSLPCPAHDGMLKEYLKRFEKSDALLSRIESKLETLPCSTHSDRHDRHEERLNNSDALLHKMEGQLEILVSNSIQKSSGKIRKSSGMAFSAKHSPRVLNDNGLSLLEDCGGWGFLNDRMDHFVSKIEQLRPKTALDVENLALAVLQAATVDDMFIPMKNWVYNAPVRTIRNTDGTTTEMEVSLDDIIFVLSLPIRDEYLKRHPL